MRYRITELDKELILQNTNALTYRMRISVTNNKRKIIDVLTGITDLGSSNIDSDSNIRRTLSCTIKLDDFINDIEAKISHWLGLYYEVEVGIFNQRTDEYKYYPYGRYCITSSSTIYNESTNSITLELSDRMAELDGTRNGQIGGAPTIKIPKIVDGKKQTLRGSTINLLKSSTNVDKYIVDDIGEFYGMPQNNDNYAEYRKLHDEWNVIPYDLEFSSGNYMSDMLFEIRDLYPNCQMYFDVYDNFCFDMIPSLDSDRSELDNDYIQQILVGASAESVSYDTKSIRNVTEVFGKDYDIDYFAEKVTYISNMYTLSLDNVGAYSKYDMIAFKPTANCSAGAKLKINSLDAIPIYYEYTTTPLNAKELLKDETAVVEIYKIEDKYVAYYLGVYQPHALCVLTNNENDSYYTKAYFSKVYNVKQKNIVFRVEHFSPFCVQRMGEVLDSKSGDEYDNIISESVAMQNAKYSNRSTTTMYDTVTITTLLLPWLDVNVKLDYKKQQEKTTYSYVVKSKSDNFADGTSTITMYRFLQLYE